MSTAAWRETMAEQFPASAPWETTIDNEWIEWGDLVTTVTRLQDDVQSINQRMRPAEALQRATRDIAAGKLASETGNPKIKTSASEAGLWK